MEEWEEKKGNYKLTEDEEGDEFEVLRGGDDEEEDIFSSIKSFIFWFMSLPVTILSIFGLCQSVNGVLLSFHSILFPIPLLQFQNSYNCGIQILMKLINSMNTIHSNYGQCVALEWINKDGLDGDHDK